MDSTVWTPRESDRGSSNLGQPWHRCCHDPGALVCDISFAPSGVLLQTAGLVKSLAAREKFWGEFYSEKLFWDMLRSVNVHMIPMALQPAVWLSCCEDGLQHLWLCCKQRTQYAAETTCHWVWLVYSCQPNKPSVFSLWRGRAFNNRNSGRLSASSVLANKARIWYRFTLGWYRFTPGGVGQHCFRVRAFT